MKVKVDSASLKNTVSALQALQHLNSGAPKPKKADGTSDDSVLGRLEVVEGTLLIDTMSGGAYAQKSVTGKTLREGAVGIDLSELSRCRLSGPVTIEYDHNTKTVQLTTSKAKYELPADQEAADVIATTKPTEAEIPIIAKVPTELLANAAAYVSIKPGLKIEDMRMQFDLRSGSISSMELVGLDFFSYGRFIRKSNEIKVRRDTKFVLKANSLSTILKSVKSALIMIGVESNGADTKLVRFKAEDADIYYPTVDFPFRDAEEVYQETCSGTCDCSFTALRKNIREAIATVKTVSVSAAVPLLLNVRVDKGAVLMAAVRDSKSAMAKVASTDRTLSSNDAAILYLNQHYFESIINLAPDVSPLRIESWDQARVIVKTAENENGKIEYYMSQSDPEQKEDGSE
jgi:hypothetical protein